jgi:uroporphyrin-III C-methyltransferase
MNGKVYLVGAGPGDRELLTVKAVRLLENADVVLHDDLVSTEVLELINPVARVENVGKRCGCKSISQDEINSRMIENASCGLAVVRLKSGDPLLFARAAEELRALREANIPYEVVPGVTTGMAAAASLELPLTERGVSSHLVFTTAHNIAGEKGIDWRGLAREDATVVIYMPGNNYESVAENLSRAGLEKSMPCAIISNVSRYSQCFATTTLENLRELSPLPSPAVLIVGEVCRSLQVGSLEQRNQELVSA